jgi:1-acyl-sn-glycerol-3-phosphate acyltransferase
MSAMPIKKRAIRYVDSVFGKILRHLVFSLVRLYYALFFNVSCSNKDKLQDLGGAIMLSNHVSRHDGQLILSCLYSTTRIRPTAYYKEYEHWAQRWPMILFGTISMSSPKTWTPEEREAQKQRTLDIMSRVLDNGNSILIFPAGGIRKGEKEEIAPYLTGAYDTIQAHFDHPVILIKLDGLGKHQYCKYDQFWSFLGLSKGRRHANLDIEVVASISTAGGREAFNQKLEDYFNGGSLAQLEADVSSSEDH